jgi:hypothetical protein
MKILPKPLHITWAAGTDAYQFDRARVENPEPEYFDALARVIQEDQPQLTYRQALNKATVIDEYTTGVLEGKEYGRRTRDLLKSERNPTPAGSPSPLIA